jgi:hypothetical protein
VYLHSVDKWCEIDPKTWCRHQSKYGSAPCTAPSHSSHGKARLRLTCRERLVAGDNLVDVSDLGRRHPAHNQHHDGPVVRRPRLGLNQPAAKAGESVAETTAQQR